MNIENLTAEEISLLKFSVNRFGTQQHPVAEDKNLQFFEDSYLRECLQKIVKSKEVTKQAKTLAQKLLTHE